MKVDLRLALPVVIGWAVLGVLIGAPAVLPVAAITAAGLAAVLVSLATVMFVRGAAHSQAGDTPRGRTADRAGNRLSRRGGREGYLLRALIACALSAGASGLLLSAAAVDAPRRQPAELLAAAHSGRAITVTAVTTQTVIAGATSYSVEIVRVTVRGGELVDDAGADASMGIPARMFGATPGVGRGIDIGIGATLMVSGTIAATAAGDDTAFLIYPRGAPTVVANPPMALDWANRLRSGFRELAARLPGDGGALLPGLAIGDTSAVSETLDIAMKASSLSHLTAVSGANCAIVVALVLAAGAFAGLGRGARIATGVVVLVGFVVLVTPEPSVLRAAAMAMLLLVSLSRGRPARGVPVLAIAVLALLVNNPWLARNYGFVLSVLATAGLLVLAAPLTVVLRRVLPLPIAAAVAIPLAAQLACQPVLVLLSPTIPVYGLAANILAEFAAPIATVVGLGACLLLPGAPAMALVAAQLAWVPAAWIAAVATFFANAPGSRLAFPGGAAGVALSAGVTILGLVVVLAPSTRWVRLSAVATLALVVAVSAGVVAGRGIHAQLTRPGDWQYAVCDVGQGDATLVRSLGRIALIDTGPEPARLSACLSALGITRIDLLVLTHYDLDHVGGTAAVFGRVGRVLVGPSDGRDDERLLQKVRDAGASVEQASRGLTGTLGALGWSVLWPTDPLHGVTPGNPASVTLRFDGIGECPHRCLDSIFLGDLGQEAQAMVLRAGELGRPGIAHVEVVKVAHHGSSDQEPRLYAALAATVGLVGVGADNGYGHPTAALLRTLATTGTAVARTDRDGLVLVSASPTGAVDVWTEHGRR